MTEPLAVIKGLVKTFDPKGPPAIDGLDATILSGRVTGLVGPDAAGKTTLMRLMAGLLAPTSGELKVCGYDTVNEPGALHEAIGYMPQRFGLYEDLSVIENLNLYADLRGVVGASARRRSKGCSPSPIFSASPRGSPARSPAA